MDCINLSGQWEWSFEKNGSYTPGFHLPGSACEAAIGEKSLPFTQMTKDTVRCLRPRYEYIGDIFLRRTVEIPQAWENSHITLFLERVNFLSEVFVDNAPLLRPFVSFSTPHTYDLSATLTPGVHELTIRISNKDILNLDHMSSGYSNDTQSFWCGIIGRVELQREDVFRIHRLSVFPRGNKIEVRACLDTDCISPEVFRSAELSLSVSDCESGEKKPEQRFSFKLYNRRQTITVIYDMGDNVKLWDTASPSLYTLDAVLLADGGQEPQPCQVRDKKSLVFGMRTFKAEGRSFLLNGKKIFLRGTLDCAIFPKTGYPPTDLDSWLYICRQLKRYGLNHIRFHSWCPPEAAFAAADIVGILILAEMPLWLNLDVCALDTGSDPVHESFFRDESLRISETYGSHPSFVMFSNGNELLGDFDMLEKITVQTKALDDRRLYTLTSNFERVPTSADDYFCAYSSYGKRLRLQTMLDELVKGTFVNFNDAVRTMDIPSVSFEVGQYCVYPDVNSLDSFNGNLLPLNFQVIRDDLAKKGLLDRAADYVYASGKLAALLYKEELEAAYRTEELGGIELLGIQDYCGQCTATVGILDQFYHSKGIVTPEEFRRFCSDSVPLMEAERIFTDDDMFTARLYTSDRRQCSYTLTISDGRTAVFEKSGSLPDTAEFALSAVVSPARLSVTLKTDCGENSWNIFVFPKRAEVAVQVPVLPDFGTEAERIAAEGGRAIILAGSLKNPIAGKFFPVFWSPAYFYSTNPCGLIIRSGHPLFEHFPTGNCSDFQWCRPMENSFCFDLTGLSRELRPIVEPVPNFFDNTPMSPLFEAKVGRGSFLFCGFSPDGSSPEEKQLWAAAVEYAASEEFAPQFELSLAEIRSLY